MADESHAKPSALTPQELRALVCAAADKHKLPPEIVWGVVMTESAGNPHAFNYEPAFFSRYVAGRKFECFGLAAEDEGNARATSYGLMQVMGQVAREHGFRAQFLTALCVPETGLEYGCRHLAEKVRLYFDRCGWAGVIASYNAGEPRLIPGSRPPRYANQTYVDKVQAHAKTFEPLEKPASRTL